MLDFNFLHFGLTIGRCALATIGWCLNWLHDFLDGVLVIDAFWHIDQDYFGGHLVHLHVWRLNGHSLR